MSKFSTIILVASIIGLNLLARTGLAQETTPKVVLNTPMLQFGSPDAVPRQLEEDSRQKGSLSGKDILSEYREWKEQFYQKTGISLTIDYTAGGQWASNTISGEDSFTSGALRFYGSSELVGRGTDNTGTLIWKIEQRHAYSTSPASEKFWSCISAIKRIEKFSLGSNSNCARPP